MAFDKNKSENHDFYALKDPKNPNFLKRKKISRGKNNPARKGERGRILKYNI